MRPQGPRPTKLLRFFKNANNNDNKNDDNNNLNSNNINDNNNAYIDNHNNNSPRPTRGPGPIGGTAFLVLFLSLLMLFFSPLFVVLFSIFSMLFFVFLSEPHAVDFELPSRPSDSVKPSFSFTNSYISAKSTF